MFTTLTFYASRTYEPLDGETGKISKAIKTTFEEIAFQSLMYLHGFLDKKAPWPSLKQLVQVGKEGDVSQTISSKCSPF